MTTQLPCNIEAEQALLGCILYDNEAYERLPDGFEWEHFSEPAHQRLFASIEKRLRSGGLADMATACTEAESDPGLIAMGGASYVMDLAERAPPTPRAAAYAREVSDLFLRREMIRLGEEMAAVSTDLAAPATDILTLMESKVFGLGADAQSSQGFAPIGSGLALAMETADAAMRRGGAVTGVTTGLIDVDAKIGGLHPSDLLILAGRPSMGKTALATNIALSAARAGAHVGFFSLEMSAEQLSMRLLSEVSGVESDRVRRGFISMPERERLQEASQEIAALPLQIDQTGGLPIAKLVARARRHKRLHGLDLLIVDYLQLVTVDGARLGNRVEAVGTITQALKAMAKELEVPVVALSQLSRAVESREDKRPQLSDLRESGSIEQDADVVMFVYREDYYLGRLEPKAGTSEHLDWETEMDQARGKAELIIGKQRHGPIGTVRLAFDDSLTRFGNLAREEYGREPYGRGA